MQTTWGTVTVVGMNPFQGSAVASTGRRLLQNGTRLAAEGTKPVSSLPCAGRPDLFGACVRASPAAPDHMLHEGQGYRERMGLTGISHKSWESL